MKIIRIILWCILFLVLAFLAQGVLRVYYLPMPRYEPDPLNSLLPLTADNIYFVPGRTLHFNCTVWADSLRTRPRVVSIIPELCRSKWQCLNSSLRRIDSEREWNEYRVSSIAYETLRNGSGLMPNLAKQQSIVYIRYYDGDQELDALREATGVMENPDYLFIHPPRSAFFGILEICPMPNLTFPIVYDSIYSNTLTMPADMVPEEYRSRYLDGMSLRCSSLVSALPDVEGFPDVHDAVLVHAVGTSDDGFLHTATNMVFSPRWGPLSFIYQTPKHIIELTRSDLQTQIVPAGN